MNFNHLTDTNDLLEDTDITEPIDPNDPGLKPISAARLLANRANSLKSTGPRSPETRAKVSLNAVKHGLTGNTIVLTPETTEAYKAHIFNYERMLQPIGPEERSLVQYMADTRWRINRIPVLEHALIAKGYRQFKHQFANPVDPYVDVTALIEIETRLAFEKEFKNLQLQEGRLNRRLDKDTARLACIQEARKAREADELHRATAACLLARHRNQPFDPEALGFGFEFSKNRMEAHVDSLKPVLRQQLLQKALAEAGESLNAAA